MADTRNTTESSDVVIVGAGVIGLACAWRAAQRGLDVVVIERDRPGAGASNVAAGMLAPVGEATWGEDRLLELALASHRLWPRFAAELGDASGRDVGYLELGALHVALDRDEAAELRRRFELMRSHGLAAEWLTPSAVPRARAGPRPGRPRRRPRPARGGGRPAGADRRAGARRSRPAGGRIEIAEVDRGRLIEGERLAGVRTAERTEHRAADGGPRRRFVVGGRLAAGAGAAADPPGQGTDPHPCRLRRSTPVCERIVVSERIYVVPRADGRLVVGATVEEQGFDTRVTAGGVHELLREAYRALPEIAELELVEAIAGLRPATPDNLPLIGPGAIDGLRARDRALPQRDPAGAADRRADRRACSAAIAPRRWQRDDDRAQRRAGAS